MGFGKPYPPFNRSQYQPGVLQRLEQQDECRLRQLPNNLSYSLGVFHRAHVIDDYLSTNNNLTFDQVRDLALNIATTDSFGGGGNPWKFVSDDFIAAVNADPSPARSAALALLAAWDGHFVDGGVGSWATGTNRADAWVLYTSDAAD